MSRLPAVAGKFYPGDPESLTREIKRHIVENCDKSRAIGIVAPHAGFMYSGDVAGSVYSRIEIPDTVILIGPNHTGQGLPVALMSRGRWSMPLGEVEIDTELAREILRASPLAGEDERAHHYEHSLETQIPFLQYFKKDFKIVPLCLMRLDYKECEALGLALADAVEQDGRPVLIVASSDMTHYESHENASKKDRDAIDAMLKRDPRALYETVESKNISMCGVNPATVMLAAGNRLGASDCRLVRYMTSGEVSGDYDHVVGYAGLIVT